ncbi:hypothetical protein ABBQ38_012258 [Trebouxia sp. C0009 RCD-2024]
MRDSTKQLTKPGTVDDARLGQVMRGNASILWRTCRMLFCCMWRGFAVHCVFGGVLGLGLVRQQSLHRAATMGRNSHSAAPPRQPFMLLLPSRAKHADVMVKANKANMTAMAALQ